MKSMNDVQDSLNIEHHHDQNHCYHKILWLQLNGGSDDDNDDYQDAQNPVCGEKWEIWGL